MAGLSKVPTGTNIWWFGDSIVVGKGCGINNPSPDRETNRPSSTFDKLLGENWPSQYTVDKDGLSSRDILGVHDQIEAKINDLTLSDGDWIIVIDGGKTVYSYANYRTHLSNIVTLCTPAGNSKGITLTPVFCTMFDYNPAEPSGNRQWDEVQPGDSFSINQAIRDESSAQGVLLVDLNANMDAVRSWMVSNGYGQDLATTPVSVVTVFDITPAGHGVHPNQFGNFVMAVSAIQSLGGDIKRMSIETTGGLYMESVGQVGNLTEPNKAESPPGNGHNWDANATSAQRWSILRNIVNIIDGGSVMSANFNNPGETSYIDCGNASDINDLLNAGKHVCILFWIKVLAASMDTATQSKIIDKGNTYRIWHNRSGLGTREIRVVSDCATTNPDYTGDTDTIGPNSAYPAGWRCFAIVMNSADKTTKIFFSDSASSPSWSEVAYNPAPTVGSGAFAVDAASKLILGNDNSPISSEQFTGKMSGFQLHAQSAPFVEPTSPSAPAFYNRFCRGYLPTNSNGILRFYKLDAKNETSLFSGIQNTWAGSLDPVLEVDYPSGHNAWSSLSPSAAGHHRWWWYGKKQRKLVKS